MNAQEKFFFYLKQDSIASKIESAAYGGGTYITEAFAPVSATASATVSKTGRFRWTLGSTRLWFAWNRSYRQRGIEAY